MYVIYELGEHSMAFFFFCTRFLRTRYRVVKTLGEGSGPRYQLPGSSGNIPHTLNLAGSLGHKTRSLASWGGVSKGLCVMFGQ